MKIATFCMKHFELFLRFGNCETYILEQFLVDSLVRRRSAYININIHMCTFYTFLYELRLHVPADVCVSERKIRGALTRFRAIQRCKQQE